VKHYETLLQGNPFIYSEFCISVTTDMNLARHMENKMNCGKVKFNNT